MVSEATQKHAKKTKKRHSVKAAADAAKIIEKRRWRLINIDKEEFRRSHKIKIGRSDICALNFERGVVGLV